VQLLGRIARLQGLRVVVQVCVRVDLHPSSGAR
jgi:hypothetical protein